MDRSVSNNTFQSSRGRDSGALVLLLLVAAASLILLPDPTLALECDDPDIRPLQGYAGYQARVGDLRCEGFYESPVRGDALKVISVTIGNAPAPKTDLLRLFVPGVRSGAIVNLHAEGLHPRLYYRMTAAITGEQTFSWPLDEVLYTQGIGFESVGVLAMGVVDEMQTLLPVALDRNWGPVEVTVRSFVDLDRLVWRLTPKDAEPVAWQEVEMQRVSAGAHRTFSFRGTGHNLLELRGRRAGTNNWIAHDVPIWLTTP